ncbi:restriction endonuclease subunit S [Ligilactobacillus salivarius]|uniref:restriction endonuclease subunit S n=1 Tax=Ligilactobacillus salivarius TaxID=1624 RepID=UPI001CBC9255|nr:restriction endonuclease subunit S [Ligilactobacillus salivarius]MBZ4030720.1 restriction endonuclease subunit S [Ligilactobacillus salivarius]
MVKMKDSGIEWIGEIPETWEVALNKFVMTKIKQIIPKYTGEPILSLSMTGVHERNLDDGGKMPSTFDGYQVVKRGNLLLCLFDIDVTPRCVGYIQADGITSPAYSQYEVNDNNSAKYYYYYYLMIDNSKILVHLTKSLRNTINADQFDNIKAIVPPKLEQQQIANFLDRKTTEIDGLIDKINTEIDTLKQYQSSVITQAVTKGLDPNVPMKDSGIEWIGEIPETWEVVKIKYYLSRNDIKNHPDEEVLSVYRDYGVVPKNSRTDNHNVTSTDTTNYKYVIEGNLVINKMKAWQGSLAVSNYTGIVSPAYYVYQFKNSKLNKRYFHYLIRNCYKSEFKRLSTGIRDGQWDLQAYDFENTSITLPPKLEQQQIADYLDQKVTQIQKLINSKQQQINQLTEYKNSLIFEYVTGKKQVKEAN